MASGLANPGLFWHPGTCGTPPIVTAPSTAYDGTHAYCYDSHWRLTNVKAGSCGGATVIGLGYDVQGNLANKNGVVYGQGGPLYWTRDERSGQRVQSVYLGGSLIAQRIQPIGMATELITWQHTDALGSPVAVTDGAKTVLQRSEYEPYGHLLNRPLQDGPGYTGHVMDAATGLVYMQQRYYATMGRFLSRDPVTAYGQPLTNFNPYVYANNNPYRFTDPDGRIAYQVGNTVYVPVTFRGSGASPALISAVVHAASNLGSQDGTRVVVVPVDRVMGGVNVMNVSPGNMNPNTKFGEGIVQGQGIIPNSGAHIDSRRTGSDLIGATLHDTMHFAHLADRYEESPTSTMGNRGRATIMAGFEDSIMGSTSGTMLMREDTEQFQDANNGLGTEEEWNKLLERINSNE